MKSNLNVTFRLQWELLVAKCANSSRKYILNNDFRSKFA